METSDLISGPIRWYRNLIPKEGKKDDLMSSYSERDIMSGLVVCGITSSEYHVFALFASYVSFTKFYLSIPVSKRCFFEIIFGERPQKPHFDIEVILDKLPPNSGSLSEFGTKLITSFITTLITRFKVKYGKSLVEETDILIFSSHGDKKQSFHVVVDNYAHTTHLEAKEFYRDIVDSLPDEYRPFIDSAVYSKKQQFRIVGSQKLGSNRIKTLISTWKSREEFKNEGHKFNLLLEASLVGYTRHCLILPNLIPETKDDQIRVTSSVTEITSQMAKLAFNLLGDKGKVSVMAPSFPYEFGCINGPFITLKRRFPSRCQICQRIHEHENPYLIVSTDENQLHHVYFDCRRSQGQRLYLGVIPEIISPELKVLKESNVVSKLCSISKVPKENNVMSKLSSISKIPMKEIRAIKNK